MAKKQKIWLAVFLAMFLIPEILWSPIFGLWSIDKNIFDIDNRNLLISIVLIQSIGCFFALQLIFKFKKFKNIFYWLFLIFASIFFMKSLFILYILFATKNMQF